jgi:CRP-like cAMP-binding protein
MLDYKNLPLFAGVSKETVDMIIKNSPRETFQKWDTILKQGDDSNGKGYIIESGEVIIWINGDSKAILKEGQIFWEIALLNEEKRVATVNAKTDLKVIVLSFDNLIELLNNDENNINKEILRRLEENLKDAPQTGWDLLEDDSPSQIKSGYMIKR